MQSFHSSYADARAAFLSAAVAARAHISSHVHPLRGLDGEELAVDVAVVGDPDASRRLLVSSGCHGVEGYCGSGVQIHALSDPALAQQCRQADVTLVYAHALSPYGFSHLRRVTQENVDLNRNFQDFARPLPSNEAYSTVHPLLVPDHWPPDPANQGALAAVIATKGLAFLQAAVSGGQYTEPAGLFFGGHAPTWSNLTFRNVAREHLASASHIGWIDLHTGLGPQGHGERIGDPETSDHERASRWWGGQGKTALTTPGDGSSSSTSVSGTIGHAVREECPHSRISAIALEFGTVPPMEVLQALRAEMWLELHPDADAETRTRIKRQFLAAFYIDTPDWKARVLEQGMEVIAQAIDGLARELAVGPRVA